MEFQWMEILFVEITFQIFYYGDGMLCVKFLKRSNPQLRKFFRTQLIKLSKH